MTPTDRAFARATDPTTSHEAAARVTPQLTENRRAVLDVLATQARPVTDAELVLIYQTHAALRHVPEQSESGIRTRRKELERDGLVQLAGSRDYGHGKRHREWQVAA